MATRDKQSDSDKDALAEFNRLFKRMDAKHAERCDAYDRRHEIYRGEYKPDDKGNEWMSELNPPEAFQCVETLFVNMLDDQPTPRVEPEGPESVDGAPVMEDVLQTHRRKDERAEKEARWLKQGLVLGVSGMKMSWKYEHATRRRTKWMLQADGSYEKTRQPESACSWDQASANVVRMHDFWWDPSASVFSEAAMCAHRTYANIAHLKDWAELVDEETNKPLYRNIDLVSQNDRGVPAPTGGLFVPDTTGKVELVELYIPARDRLITVANRTVVIRDSAFPFDHGELPFSVFTSQPDLYRVDGFSEVEHLEDLQLAAWAALNQMVDGIRFVANPVIISNHPDQLKEQGKIFPGAILKGSKESFDTWQPPLGFIEALTSLRQTVEAKMESATGATPAISGSGDQEGVDPNTATEFYGKQQAASRRLLAKKNLFSLCRERLGRQEMALEQQCLDKPVQVPVKGAKNQWKWVHPHELVGTYSYRIDDAAEALNQAQKRSEAQLLVGLILSPPFMQMLLSNVMRPAANEILEYLADAFDRPDIPSWVEPIPPPPGVPIPGSPSLGGGPGLAGVPVSPGNPASATPLLAPPGAGGQGTPTPLSPPAMPTAA